MELLTRSNPKTEKGLALGWETMILHLAPHTSAGIRSRSGELINVCPNAGNCVAPCLNYSGHGGIGNPETNTVQRARRARTRLYFEDRPAFLDQLASEISRAEKRASKAGKRLAIRPNGTSDLPALGAWVAEQFPHLQVYDYTKIPRAWKRVRENYSLKFSWEGSNWRQCRNALTHGVNVAVPFLGEIPETFRGFPVADGDKTDLRFLDPAGHIIGLTAKGPAKRDFSGFVVR